MVGSTLRIVGSTVRMVGSKVRMVGSTVRMVGSTVRMVGRQWGDSENGGETVKVLIFCWSWLRSDWQTAAIHNEKDGNLSCQERKPGK